MCVKDRTWPFCNISIVMSNLHRSIWHGGIVAWFGWTNLKHLWVWNKYSSFSMISFVSHMSMHRPYSRQVTVNGVCDVAIHPPPSVYPKAGNGALRDQWAIKYHCQNDSPTIVFTVRDLVHWNYVISEYIPRLCKSWKPMLIHVFATYIFLFIRHSLHCNWLPVNCGVAASIGPPMN